MGEAESARGCREAGHKTHTHTDAAVAEIKEGKSGWMYLFSCGPNSHSEMRTAGDMCVFPLMSLQGRRESFFVAHL